MELIGCRILRAVSDILRTQCGRRGSGTRETSFILLAPLWLGSPLSLTYSLTPGRRRRSAFLPRAMGGLSGALAITSDQTGPQRRCRRHRRAAGGGSGPAGIAGATGAPCILSHLAGVGGQPLANGYGRTAGDARGRARSNQATSSLPLSSARSGGASLGWHGQRVAIPARRVLGGSGAVALSFARA